MQPRGDGHACPATSPRLHAEVAGQASRSSGRPAWTFYTRLGGWGDRSEGAQEERGRDGAKNGRPSSGGHHVGAAGGAVLPAVPVLQVTIDEKQIQPIL
jgi:hypothetical protein